MFESGQFTAGEPGFISSRPEYSYRFCAAISSRDLSGDLVVHQPIELGEGATVVAIALLADGEYLAIEGNNVQEIEVPAEGDSAVAEFVVRGLKPGTSQLEVLIYHKGCLTLRETTAQIIVKRIPGSVSNKIGLPITAPVMSKGDDLGVAASAVVQTRVASLLIAPPMANPGKHLVFALFYEDQSGCHFDTARVPIESVQIDRAYLRERLTALLGQRKAFLGWRWFPFPRVFMQNTFNLEIAPEDAQRGLAVLKQIGLRLWSNIFEGFDGLQRIRQQLSKLLDSADNKGVLQIVSNDVFLPWQLVYINDDKEEPDPHKFWGMRFQTEQSLPQGLDLKTSAPHKANEPITAFINTNLPAATLRAHKQIFETFRNKETELLSDLKRLNNTTPALYLYCHAEYNNQDKQESWIELTNEGARLTLGKLQSTRVDPKTSNQIEFLSAPLVFLNACNSGDMDSEIYQSFVGFMLRDKKAGGVLGTETKMPAFFATTLAKEFWRRVSENPAPVSEILFDVRTEYWRKHNNPLGFLYSLYTNGDFTVHVP
jgi:hypothetical protein